MGVTEGASRVMVEGAIIACIASLVRGHKILCEGLVAEAQR